MKKFFAVLTAVVCLTLCALGLVACNTDEDELVEVKGITLDVTELTLKEGEYYALTATVTPSNASNQEIEWLTSNDRVATVDNGNVVAVAEGKATISVTTKNGKTASCAVTVEAEMEESPVKCTVTLYANGGVFEGGSDTYEMQVNHGDRLSGDLTVTRGDKYIFTNWYTDENRTNLWYLDEDIVTEDIELFAGWKYLNKYQSVIDSLEERIKAQLQDNSADVEILSLFKDKDGYLCFVEKNGKDVFSYKTDIYGFDEIVGDADIILQISNTTLTQLKTYNDKYTSENNSYVADNMAYKYTSALNANDAIIYSCVSEWKLYSEGDFSTNGPWYGCQIKAIIADENGNVFDCSFTVVAPIADYSLVIGGSVLSEAVDLIMIELGEISNDFYSEYIKSQQA